MCHGTNYITACGFLEDIRVMYISMYTCSLALINAHQKNLNKIL